MGQLARSDKANYIVFNNLQALYNSEGELHYVKYSQVSSIVDRIYTDKDVNKNNSDIILVFLGIYESQEGQPYWALDLTPKGELKAEYDQLIQGIQY